MSPKHERAAIKLSREIRNLEQAADYADELSHHHLTSPAAAGRYQAQATVHRALATQKRAEQHQQQQARANTLFN